MSQLFEALGINLKALIFQAINFGIVLVVLTIFVYRPLAKYMEERRKRIELGIKGGEEAARRLAAVDVESQERLRKADAAALTVVKESEQTGKKRFEEIVHGAEAKADYLLKEAAATSKRREVEAMDKVMAEAQALIKSALIKTVELDPKHVDEKLISQAINEV